MTEKELLASMSEEANAKKDSNTNESELTSNAVPTEQSDSSSQADKVEQSETSSRVKEDSEGDDKNSPPITTSPAEENLPSAQENSVANQEAKVNDSEEEAEEEEEKPMTLLDHLKELRHRLTRIVIVIFVGFFACYNFAELAYTYLAIPLTENMPEGSTLIYTSPPGAFFVYLKISLVLSFLLSCPYSFYQIWAFIAPGLYKEEKKVLLPLSFTSAFFFLAGVAFCYILVLPIAFKFFMGFATAEIVPMISIEEYLNFVLKLLIAFGLVFEMPLFAFFLARMGVLTPERMKKWRKYSILVIFIVAALLTPPDVFSQLLMAAPMIILYEVSVILTAIVAKKKKEEKEANEKNSEEEN